MVITYVSIANYATLGVDSWCYAPQTPYTRSRCSRLETVEIIDLVPFIIGMPKGLKQSSSVVSIGFGVDESAANTFTQSSVDLNLSPLDREVFVVLAVNLNPFTPDAIDKTDTSVQCSLSSTSQTGVTNIANSNCLADAGNFIKAVSATGMATGFQSGAFETPPSNLPYIGIIATNDFFIQVAGAGNATAKGMVGKLYGYRAIADADIYAALVQSEVLSA